MAAIELEANEKNLGAWTLNYLPPKGGRYTGRFIVTSQRLIFEARFDTSVRGTIEGGLLSTDNEDACLIIPKSRIKDVEVKKSLFSKKVLVTLDNGDVHTFHYGMLSVNAMADAVRRQD